MSRRRRRRNTQYPPRVVNYSNANRRLRRVYTPTVLRQWSPLPLLNQVLTEIEDRRQFHPSGPYRSARSMTNPHHNLVVSNPFSTNWSNVGFQHPKKILICIRRKQRREVLLAKNRGGGGNAKPRHKYYEDIKC